LVALGRPGEAIVEYRSTLQKEPNRRHARLRLARLSATND